MAKQIEPNEVQLRNWNHAVDRVIRKTRYTEREKAVVTIKHLEMIGDTYCGSVRCTNENFQGYAFVRVGRRGAIRYLDEIYTA